MTIATLVELFGWTSVINIGVLVFSTLLLWIAGKPIAKLHSSIFDLSEKDLKRAYFQYLGQYKIAILVLNLAPYLALKIMGH